MSIDENRNNAVQSMLNRSYDPIGRIKLAKFRLFIYSKLDLKIKRFIELYISVESPGSPNQQDVFILEIRLIREKL